VSPDRPLDLPRLQWAALLIGLLALVVAAAGAALDLRSFLQAWLAALLAWLALPTGALGMLLVWHLMGGRWGLVLGDALEAMAGTLPLIALLFLPVLFAIGALYPWAQPEFVSAHETVARKAAYLNEPFFVLRALIYFAIWIGLAFVLGVWRDRAAVHARSLPLGAAGAVVLAPTASFAGVDWILSLEPTFHSSIFGMLWLSTQALGAFAFALVLALLLARGPRTAHLREQGLVGLGSLLLALVLLWGYFAFIQYLIIWSGDLPDAAAWYVARGEGLWRVSIWLTVAGHLVLPAIALLSSRARQSPRIVLLLAAIVLLAHFADVAWLTVPAFDPAPSAWLVLATMAAIGGLWLFAFTWLLAPRTPPLDRSVEEIGHG
jgi:hypothetical protein